LIFTLEFSMFHTDLSESQLKQSINAEQALQAFYLSASRAHSYRGGMVWREKNGVDYLVKTAPNGTQRGMGARSPETEQIFSDFKAGKQASEEAARVALHMLDETERMNKALRIGRCPNVIIAILSAIRKANLAEHFMVIGTNALYAYEAQAGVRFQDDVTATLDLDFLERVHDFSVVDQKSFQDGMQGAKHRRAGSPARLCNAADRMKGHLSGTDEIVNTFLMDSRKQISLVIKEDLRKEGFLGILKKADPTFALLPDQLYSAANASGYIVDLVKRRPKTLKDDKEPQQVFDNEDDFWAAKIINMDWLLSAPKFRQVVVGLNGKMAEMVVPDPRAFVLFKVWMAGLDNRDPRKKPRDLKQAKAVAELIAERMPHLRFDQMHVFPELLRKPF
jgi:hypothetical protein